MAMIRPLKFGDDGFPREAAADDVLDIAGQSKDVFTAENDSGGTIPVGAPVYMSGAGTVRPAQANAAGTKNVIGLAAEAINDEATGLIQTDGVLTLTTGQWDAVAGTTGGLTANTRYFLSAANAGELVSTVPGAGAYLVQVGIAISTTELEIQIAYIGKKAA